MESNVEFELSQPLRVLTSLQLNQAIDVTPPPQRTLFVGREVELAVLRKAGGAGAAGAGAGRPPR